MINRVYQEEFHKNFPICRYLMKSDPIILPEMSSKNNSHENMTTTVDVRTQDHIQMLAGDWQRLRYVAGVIPLPNGKMAL